MKLCESKPSIEYDEDCHEPETDLRRWRWQLKLEFFRSPKSVWLSLDRQIQMDRDSDWMDAKSYMGVGFSPFVWCRGFAMAFYEVEYWRFSFGPFHVNWTA